MCLCLCLCMCLCLCGAPTGMKGGSATKFILETVYACAVQRAATTAANSVRISDTLMRFEEAVRRTYLQVR